MSICEADNGPEADPGQSVFGEWRRRVRGGRLKEAADRWAGGVSLVAVKVDWRGTDPGWTGRNDPGVLESGGLSRVARPRPPRPPRPWRGAARKWTESLNDPVCAETVERGRAG